MNAAERFTEIWNSLSRIQRNYVVLAGDYVRKADAARAAGLKPGTVYSWPHIVEEAVGLLQLDLLSGAQEELRVAVARAAMVKIEGLDEADARLRQSAASEILDRVLGKAKARGDAGPEGVSEVLVSYVEEDQLHRED